MGFACYSGTSGCQIIDRDLMTSVGKFGHFYFAVSSLDHSDDHLRRLPLGVLEVDVFVGGGG